MQQEKMRPSTIGVAGFYFFMFVLVFWPMADLLSSIWPLQLGNLQWRYGAMGLMAAYLHTPILALLLASLLCFVLNHRPALRLISILCLALGLFGPAPIALYAFPAVGFFMSVMYPIIISLALNSVEKQHGAFAGILMTGIMGGAVVQLLIGGLADLTTLRIAMMFNFVTLGYILSISIWAKPLVRNKTVKLFGSSK